MTVTQNIVKKKLKIKFVSKKLEAEPRSEACEIGQQMCMNDTCGHSISLNGNNKSVMKKSHDFVPHSPDNPKLYAANNLKVKSPVQGSTKRGLSGMIDSQKEKRQKMDHSVKRQCGSILKTLMAHPFGFDFNSPVDPVALNIPDYFSIITEPMDLGTIKTKLQDNMYFSVEEFAADVRLTFYNAMKYNPLSNPFHSMAKKLDNIFNRRWKLLEAKWKCNSNNVEQSRISSCSEKKTQETRQSFPRKSPVLVSSLPKMSMSSEEERKLRNELVEAVRGKMGEKLQTFPRRLGLSFEKGEKVEIEIDRFDDKALQELKRVVNGSLDARAAKLEPEKMTQNGRRLLLGKVSHKVSGNRSTCSPANTIPPLSMVACKCGSCGSVRCQCSLQNDYAHASSIERSLGQDCGASKMDHDVKNMVAPNTSKSDPESDGAVSALDEENICSSPRLSTLATTAASGDGWTPGIDVQLSPKKALRAAMLKSRFGETILKAKQKTLLDHGNKADPVQMQLEKERLKRQQQEEKARIEAQIRAAEVASRLRAEEEWKMQREREREAARIALQKMEKTVEIDENLKILKDLEMFSRCTSSDHLFDGEDGSEVIIKGSEGDHFGNPLERLGLFIKDDYIGDEDEEDEANLNGDGEEGEIFS